jgi:hypothetical protein
MKVELSPIGYNGRVIGSQNVAGLCQFASNAQAEAGRREDRAISCRTIGRAIGNSRMLYDSFNVEPVSAKVGGGAAGGTTGDTNVLYSGANSFTYHIKGTQTITAPSLGASGLNISMDQTDNDGVELVLGGLKSFGRYVSIVGTSDAVEFRVKFSIADVSGTDDCAIGFRKMEAFQAAIDNYDEMACFNVISGDIYLETILNNGATTSTDTTDNWADGATKELKVRVYKSGRVKYFIDGVAPTVTAQFTFDAGEVIIPFIYFLHSTDVAGEVNIEEMEFSTYIGD